MAKKTKNPFFSIITVSLNAKKEIERTERSIYVQNNKNFEWIVVDGGSTDGTVQFLEKKESADQIISEKDNGIYDAMNKGIKIAQGEYCLFLNAGDELHDVQISEKILRHLTADIVVGRMQVIYPENSWKNEIRNFEKQNIGKRYFYYQSLPHPATFIKRDIFFSHGFYDDTFLIAGDHDFFARVFIKGVSIGLAPLCVSRFYMDGISTKMKKTDVVKNEIKKMRKKNFSIFYRKWRRIAELVGV